MFNNPMGMVGRVIDLKLVLADKAVEMLPERIRPGVRRAGTEVLACLNERLSAWLGENPHAPPAKTDDKLKKIELD
jgi:hypothetical protein